MTRKVHRFGTLKSGISWIRINQLGYLPQSVKVAVFMSEEPADIQEYALIDAFTGQTVRTFNSTKATGKIGAREDYLYRLDFGVILTSQELII